MLTTPYTKMASCGQKRVQEYEFNYDLFEKCFKKGLFEKVFPHSINISLDTRGFCCSQFSLSPNFRKLQGPPVYQSYLEWSLH